MRPEALDAAIREDRAAGVLPIAAVATVGTTSTHERRPGARHRRHLRGAKGLWLHVDAAYAGVAAMVPGWEWATSRAAPARTRWSSIPHKWLFTPFDLSAFYCRRMDVLRLGLLAGARVL